MLPLNYWLINEVYELICRLESLLTVTNKGIIVYACLL